MQKEESTAQSLMLILVDQMYVSIEQKMSKKHIHTHKIKLRIFFPKINLNIRTRAAKNNQMSWEKLFAWKIWFKINIEICWIGQRKKICRTETYFLDNIERVSARTVGLFYDSRPMQNSCSTKFFFPFFPNEKTNEWNIKMGSPVKIY